ncbi:MAG: pentapeptide repeat-containing protein [Oxalobacteraceae bacterium]|nr:MAG: pentapeptide repeat-containing protein [Oxalobacteraceae bacterium]
MAEVVLLSLVAKSPMLVRVPVTAAMRMFVGSVSKNEAKVLLGALTELWPVRANGFALGPYLILLWDLIRRQGGDLRSALLNIVSDGDADVARLSGISLKDWDLAQDLKTSALVIDASGSDLAKVNLAGMDLRRSKFSEAVLDGVDFRGCNLEGVAFTYSMIFECSFASANLISADFRGVDPDIDITAVNSAGADAILSGKAAIGYLRYHGGITDPVDDLYVLQNHPRFPIVHKISEKLTTNRNNQLRGLTQRGEAQSDPRFARALIDRFVSLRWAEIDKNDLVSITGDGRSALLRLTEGDAMPAEIAAFLIGWR